MRYIDMRSDTVTQPTQAMRDAMYNAVVGDDVYGEDDTIIELEKLAAEMTGKEAALFVPSGTMGNQLAVMTHTHRGDEVIVDQNSHIFQHEVGAAAVLSGVTIRTIESRRGIIDIDAVKRAIRDNDIHVPRTGLICVENATAMGYVVPLEHLQNIYRFAQQAQIPVHMDGARLFNAAAALNVTADKIAEFTDSVMFCLSKGLCAPVGSILAGSKAFIEKARKNRKLLGGGMRQAGFLAAAGIIALKEMAELLKDDHENAKILAYGLNQIPGIEILVEEVDINLVFFRILKEIDPLELKQKLLEKGIKVNAPEGGYMRLVTNQGVTKEDVQYVLEVMKEVLAN